MTLKQKMPKPLGLSLDVGSHKEADIDLSRKELDALGDRVEEASRKELEGIVDTLRKKLKNPYQDRELNMLQGQLENREYKLEEIRSTLLGFLMKIAASDLKGGAVGGAPKFKFHSVQVHGIMTNGRRKTRKNVVSVDGKKGEKRVEIYDSTKKRKTYKNSKKLSAKEIANIRRGKFMPGLFRGL